MINGAKHAQLGLQTVFTHHVVVLRSWLTAQLQQVINQSSCTCHALSTWCGFGTQSCEITHQSSGLNTDFFAHLLGRCVGKFTCPAKCFTCPIGLVTWGFHAPFQNLYVPTGQVNFMMYLPWPVFYMGEQVGQPLMFSPDLVVSIWSLWTYSNFHRFTPKGVNSHSVVWTGHQATILEIFICSLTMMRWHSLIIFLFV